MARPLRLEFSGAVWHVTSRGNEKRTIFTDVTDRASFLQLLARAVDQFRWRIHSYVLMGNHYHLLLETPEPTLSSGMRDLNGIYTQRFNRRHKRNGHLMQGRFKGILVEREAHLLELIRYVVLNPVRAALVDRPEEWRWSSYRATAGLVPAPAWLEMDWTLAQFAASAAAARPLYRAFVSAGLANSGRPWEHLSGQIYLGSHDFQRHMRTRIESRSSVSDEVPRRQRLPARPSIDHVVAATASAFGLRPNEIIRSHGGRPRTIVALLARIEAAEGFSSIGRVLSIKLSGAAKLAARGRQLMKDDPDFRRKVHEVTRELRSQEDRIQT